MQINLSIEQKTPWETKNYKPIVVSYLFWLWSMMEFFRFGRIFGTMLENGIWSYFMGLLQTQTDFNNSFGIYFICFKGFSRNLEQGWWVKVLDTRNLS